MKITREVVPHKGRIYYLAEHSLSNSYGVGRTPERAIRDLRHNYRVLKSIHEQCPKGKYHRD